MLNLFPNHFDPTDWQGPRACQFPDREDAFQQLAGDALQEWYGLQANISPTKGQDGAIDAFVEEGTASNVQLDLARPFIVECKDHDDTLAGLRTNILTGWDRVEEKLARQAAQGWPERYQPWRRARGYVYCISAVLPHQALRDELNARIRAFFDGLPAQQRPPLQAMRVLDWSDLRALFNALPRLADRWLGAGLQSLQGHGEYLASLTHFRRYLLPEGLPFVPPSEHDPAHPQRILEHLEAQAGQSGVLLKGVGGVGKTRTALEVATLADQRGWRVLHVLPGEPAVNAEAIARAVLADADQPVLLVFDYLDQMPELDLGALRHRLLPQAQQRGIRLALLANLRPAALRSPHPEREALFTTRVTLQPTESQKADITAQALDRIAPTAVAHLGADRVRELCGLRPIIALFIAGELQRLALEGRLQPESLGPLRPGDLLGWLRRRLAQDGLVVSPGGGFLAPEPEPTLIAAASVLAAAPLHPTSMQQAAADVCAALGLQEARLPERLLTSLRQLGWLEEREGLWAAAHDVVADEALAQVLWEQESGDLRSHHLAPLLAPALTQAQVLGRYATALTRLQGAEAQEAGREIALQQQAAAWLRAQASDLGVTLAATPTDISAYALGALLATPVWAETCVAAWQALLTPWLTRHGRQPEARHLLYRGLRELPRDGAVTLPSAALAWLDLHRTRPEASYVLAPLLDRPDLSKEDAQRAIRDALDWLAQHSLILEAGFVLPPLLGRPDLSKEVAQQAIRDALDWLAQHPLTLDAEFVLHPLLDRPDLMKEDAQRAIRYALDWLAQYPLILEAGFVLTPLLGRPDLSKEVAQQAIRYAVDWLAQHPLILEAQFVLHPLLFRQDLSKADAQQAIRDALDWLGQHPLSLEAGFVLNPLLGRPDLSKAGTQHAIRYAVDWLAQHPLILDAGFVLDPLLGRPDLMKEDAQQAIRDALDWLAHHPLSLEAGFVLDPLLGRPDLTKEDAHQAICFAMDWLDHHGEAIDAEFVLKRLFGLPQLTDAQRTRCVTHALPHLRRLEISLDASYLLKGCLRDRGLEGEAARQVVRHALAWVRAHPTAEGADFVFSRLLRRQELCDADWLAMANIAIAWLVRHPHLDDRDLGLAALLVRAHLLDRRQRQWVVDQAENHLAHPPTHAHPTGMLHTALERFYRHRPEEDVPPLGDGGSTMEKLQSAARGEAVCLSHAEIVQLAALAENALNAGRQETAGRLLPGMQAVLPGLDDQELRLRIERLVRRNRASREPPA